MAKLQNKKTLTNNAKKRTRPLASEDKKPQKRRQFIQHEAAKLFSEYGYSAATMDQLSERTKLNKGTLYYYYQSKADILYEICIKSATAKVEKLIEPCLKMEHATDGINHFIEMMVNWTLDDREEVKVYFQERRHFRRIFNNEQNSIFEEQQRSISKTLSLLIEKGNKSGEFNSTGDKFVSRFIFGLILWIYQWPENDIDANQVSTSASAFILHGLSSKK